MTLFGTHVPVSPWSALAILIGGVVSAALFRPLARARGYQAGPTLTTLLSLSVILALTVTPDGTRPPFGIAACIPVGWDDVPVDILNDGGRVPGVLLNAALFMPLALSVVLTTRRTWPALVVVPALSPVIEAVQSELPGRSCALTDVLSNVAGALAGAAIGVVISRRRAAATCWRPTCRQE